MGIWDAGIKREMPMSEGRSHGIVFLSPGTAIVCWCVLTFLRDDSNIAHNLNSNTKRDCLLDRVLDSAHVLRSKRGFPLHVIFWW